MTRTALILVGPALDLHALDASNLHDSRLYAADHHHVLRPRAKFSE
jgi:precorrin-4/cobalt-precorrin-4 C11-methyltransferase